MIAMDGAHLHVIHASRDASNLNDQSVVLRLVAGESSFLLTGDLGDEGERELLRTGAVVDADVLKIGHHGSRFSSSPEFLARVDSGVNLISAGANNPYGHPALELLDRIDDSLVFRTDQNGDITISTDGDRLWVQTQR
jgi:competence protein ComEC